MLGHCFVVFVVLLFGLINYLVDIDVDIDIGVVAVSMLFFLVFIRVLALLFFVEFELNHDIDHPFQVYLMLNHNLLHDHVEPD